MNNVNITCVVGKTSEEVWVSAQVIKSELAGQKWIVITLAKAEESELLDLAEVGGELLHEWEGWQEAVKTREQAREQIEKLWEGMDPNLKMEAIMGWWDKGVIKIFGRGGAAYLGRGGKVARLGKEMNGEWWSEGEMVAGDRLLAANNRLNEYLGSSKVAALYGQENMEEQLPLMIQEDAGSEGRGGVVVSIKEEIVEVKEESKWKWKWGDNREIRIEEGVKPKKGLWVGVAVLAVLVIMIGLGVVRKEKNTQAQAFAEIESGVNARMVQAREVGEKDPTAGKQLLKEARGSAQTYLDGEVPASYKSKIIQLIAEIEKTEELMLKKNEVQLTTIVELSVLESGFASKQMNNDGKVNLQWMGEGDGGVLSMNLSDRSKLQVSTEDVPEGIAMATTESEVFWLEPKGVWKSNWKKPEWKQVIEADEFWLEPKLIELFAGNVYVLDQKQSEIWKYPAITDGYGSRRRWLAPGITPDLSHVVDMKVAGDIWMITDTGKIVRYSRGSSVNFVLEGYPYASDEAVLKNPRALFVNENTVYVAENGAGRVVAMSQEGKFEAQYVNAEFENIDDLVVIDSKAYVLMGNVVKEFGL